MESRGRIATTERLGVALLTAEDGDALHAVIVDPRLFTSTGARPPTPEEWAAALPHWLAGASPDGRETWLNAVVRERASGEVVGHLQATLADAVAEVAWVVGVPWQGRGYAREAAPVWVRWVLERPGVETAVARIRPGHAASEHVAAACGLAPTGVLDDDGEQLWRSSR